jgi:predicted nucleotidyltransferase
MPEQEWSLSQCPLLLRKQEKATRFVDLLRQYKPVLQERYKVRSLGIFGSYVRSEQKKGSDLDILVEFDEVPSFIQFLQLEHYLSDLLGVSVDLVMKDALKPTIGKRILSEVVLV